MTVICQRLDSLAEQIGRVASVVDRSARPTHLRKLGGGAVTTMHAFDLVTGEGVLPLVLRRYPPGRKWKAVLLSMLRTLAILEAEALPAPRVRWSDPEGTTVGVPAVVLTRFRGRAIGRPRDARRWAGQLGEVLARIHAVPTAKYDFSYLPPAFEVGRAFLERALAPTAEVAAHPLAGIVLGGLDKLRRTLCAEGPTFTHGDFWPAQSIWLRGQLQGIVDWDFARLDDPGVDVGYCRMDIAIMTSRNVADEFLRAYELASGSAMRNMRFWDLIAAFQAIERPGHWHRVGFTGIGRPELRGAFLERQLTRFVSAV